MVEKGINKILVPLDGSNHSLKGLDKAIYLAELSKASITILSIITIYPTLAATVIDYKKYLTKKSEEFLNSATSKVEKKGITVKKEILQGKASTEITKYAKKHNFDLIVIGSRGLDGIKAKLVGSVSNAVVQKADVPVFVVK